MFVLAHPAPSSFLIRGPGTLMLIIVPMVSGLTPLGMRNHDAEEGDGGETGGAKGRSGMGVEWVGDSLERSLHRGHRGRGHNHVGGVKSGWRRVWA
jgi:hypothetical protein